MHKCQDWFITLYKVCKNIFFCTLFLIPTFACFSPKDPSEHVNIRILNKADLTMSGIYLKSSTGRGETDSQSYFSLDPGEHSRYKATEPIKANYEKIEIHFDNYDKKAGGRPSPVVDLGIPELEIGHYYTFELEHEAIDAFWDNINVKIIEDENPNK